MSQMTIKTKTKIFESYKKVEGVLVVRYEDLMNDSLRTMQKICDYLKIGITEEEIKNISGFYDINFMNYVIII